ncbi:Glycine--tRNA ligase beta subunit [Nymphon striatum]|nr:Glycine--tRNA ligase beta subunit [Nymphon striatum]
MRMVTQPRRLKVLRVLVVLARMILEEIETPKGIWLVFRQDVAGKATSELVPEIVNKSLAKLPIPKRMRWGSSDIEFVRPVHWIVMMLGSDVINGEVLGIKSGNQTFGHRFHHPEAITINTAESYAQQLHDEGQVIASFEDRRNEVRKASGRKCSKTVKSVLESNREATKKIVFQQKLGTLYEKTERVSTLAGYIANEVGADKQLAMRAAELSKCDLLSNMVQEFAELQGIMGSYYAKHDNEDDGVAAAMQEQYQPGFAGDVIPLVAEFAKMAESESLAAANKRISNILKKVETEIPQEVDESLLNEAQEKALYDAISAQQSIVQPLFANGDYSQALTSLAVLREDVDNFFDNIMVMDDNEAVKK